jgi:hypothetical protein
LHALNEGLAFGLELLMLAGLCWWAPPSPQASRAGSGSRSPRRQLP